NSAAVWPHLTPLAALVAVSVATLQRWPYTAVLIQLQLVVFSTEGSGANVEKPFEGHFHSNGTKNYVLSLYAESAQMQDSGTYYCAKQDHTVTQLPKALSINLPAKGKNFPSPKPCTALDLTVAQVHRCSCTAVNSLAEPCVTKLGIFVKFYMDSVCASVSLCAICLTRWWERVCCCRGRGVTSPSNWDPRTTAWREEP
uniref:Immunoglobulin V-set domain-containing protein n=1 Tax=Gopherus agassizii TaxID=38772 RepID=A0A452H9F3_9SAUR